MAMPVDQIWLPSEFYHDSERVVAPIKKGTEYESDLLFNTSSFWLLTWFWYFVATCEKIWTEGTPLRMTNKNLPHIWNIVFFCPALGLSIDPQLATGFDQVESLVGPMQDRASVIESCPAFSNVRCLSDPDTTWSFFYNWWHWKTSKLSIGDSCLNWVWVYSNLKTLYRGD